MRQYGRILWGLAWGCCAAGTALGQGDLAVYDTFVRLSPAVFSISVEIPKEYILKRYEESTKRLREYQESYIDTVTSSTGTVLNYNLIETLVEQWGRQLEVLKNQMLTNNRVRGAGFAVDPHHLVTLSTVVKSATLGGEIMILNDNNQPVAKAVLQGIDTMTGIAVLQSNNTTFSTFVNLDRSPTQLPVASYIMTIQRPYDLPTSPFSGMIGGYGRHLKLFELERFIQADIPLYPGNEGAPVFSPSGQLIGMMATEFHIGRWPGVAFIIPAEIVADSAEGIIRDGKREHGWIAGLALKPWVSGVLIEEIDQNSVARSAGLCEGDIIVGFNGDRVNNNPWDLVYRILKTKPNEQIKFQIQRGNSMMDVVVETVVRKEQ